ncbi:glycoprotein 3-alpha-L-fucosyltransferase A [Patella vulgata]|uniref:glycoprotein 3-alpha-L-fucosyltransferase A n=1 Tax=Patella vulgata TaxID=6465 RepID=UPI00217FCBE5|nr:glycoprotein 3-alpha-L-fucosyltransferase A [Patella vulgata]XP_050404827.1 glycoprotein 3-alpha-L-fucosyltransferase A [Patella vulgata]XP_050404828.1 glycoprotein 3-alpha-L-fucosyltransferase A [Patella vulgata]XP_050404829.1 glycoprotein 3-alpha-L-fucosyltransferase A [Patella vulgata]
MNTNLRIFLILTVIIGLSVLTVIRHPMVFRRHLVYVGRFLNRDTNTSEPKEPLIALGGEKKTFELSTVKKEDNEKMIRAIPDTKTITYKEISLVNSPGWYLDSLPRERVFLNCEIETCRLRKGWKYFNTSDAVVFYGVYSSLRTPPKRTKHDQIWVVSGWESPYHSGSKVWSNQGWKDQINWTMTYRLDSDIPVPYGFVKKLENKSNKDYGKIMTNKKKMVAWVVSNCHTPGQRMKYVKQLKEIVPVDVFGRCGSPIPKDLFGMINQTYKFYLSFENSLCKDYITEKFFMRQNLDVVLITRGGGDYTKFYPQESFINSNKFKNAHELGKFLLKLDKDNNTYLNYLKSKESYRSYNFGVTIKKGLCDMCKMLHDKKIHRNVYKDYNEWWWKSDCNSKPTDIIL